MPQPAKEQDAGAPAQEERRATGASSAARERVVPHVTCDRFEAFEKMRFVRLGGEDSSSRQWDSGPGGPGSAAGRGRGRGPTLMEAKKDVMPTSDVIRSKFAGGTVAKVGRINMLTTTSADVSDDSGI